MKIKPLLFAAVFASLAAVFWTPQAPAESTRYWEQTSYASLVKGTLEGLALTGDGTLRLGPRFDLLKETDSAYLWATVEDGKKNIYVGGGSPGRIYKIPPTGDPSVFFEAQELEIHALAVDRQGRLYAAAAPDGPIYRLNADGKSSVFYNPKTKYVWAIAFDSKENLYVATGDKGQIFRVAPDGEPKLFFSSDETHIRSLIVDRDDNVIAGTDGSGLILRIRPDGEPFVLYESPKKEVTALALDRDGSLYAAAVGDKPLVPGQPQPVVVQPVPVQPGQVPPKNPPTVLTMNLAGGSEVYRITRDASAQKIWSSRNDLVYSLALNAQGRLLLGTGNEGRIYELSSAGSMTNLVHSRSAQVTALLNIGGASGDVLVATSNVGRIHRLRPEFAEKGSFVSEVFDAQRAALWGTISWRQQLPPGASIRFETRTGNSSNTLLNWSPWKEAPANGSPNDLEASSASPRGRFFQWRATLASPKNDRTPELSSVRAAYLPNNVAPVIDELQPTQPGYKFQVLNFGLQNQPKTITLQPLGQPVVPQPQPMRIGLPSQLVADKGYVGLRWLASDDNDDTLTYSVYIRGEGEKDWKLLKEGLSDMYYSWDSANWPDGTYVVKIVASDAPSNPTGEALTVSRESPPFDIDNTPPEIRDLKCSPDGKRLKISFHAADRQSTIQSAEYSIDGGEWKPALPLGRISDARALDYQFDTDEVAAGEHTVVVRSTDRFQNEAVAKTLVSTAQGPGR